MRQITPAPGRRQAPVSLVSMPFKDLRHPPIQLGILEQCLTRVGIAAARIPLSSRLWSISTVEPPTRTKASGSQ